MKLYHRTSIAEATEVVRSGFRDAKWQFDIRDREGETLKKVGVWLTDRALGETEGPPGDALLVVDLDLSEDTLGAFELEGVFWDTRLFVIPAEIVNPNARVRIDQVDPRTSWFFEAPRNEE
jgi:hypothetical protein